MPNRSKPLSVGRSRGGAPAPPVTRRTAARQALSTDAAVPANSCARRGALVDEVSIDGLCGVHRTRRRDHSRGRVRRRPRLAHGPVGGAAAGAVRASAYRFTHRKPFLCSRDAGRRWARRQPRRPRRGRHGAAPGGARRRLVPGRCPRRRARRADGDATDVARGTASGPTGRRGHGWDGPTRWTPWSSDWSAAAEWQGDPIGRLIR